MAVLLDLFSGICWTFVYVLAIWQGIKNKTWCIPKLAICQNFAWELWIVIYRITGKQQFGVLFGVQLAWLLLDIFIVAIWLYFDKGDRSHQVKKLLLLFGVMFVMYIPTNYCHEWEFAAFLINMIMSVAFVLRLRRNDSLWKSIPIAILKLIGTFAPTIEYGILSGNPLNLWLGGLCFLFDVYYLIILIQANEGKVKSLEK